MWHKQFMSANIMTGQWKQTQLAYPKFLLTTICKRVQIKYLPVMKCILQIVVMTCCQSIAKWVSLFKRFVRAAPALFCYRSNLSVVYPPQQSWYKPKESKDVYAEMYQLSCMSYKVYHVCLQHSCLITATTQTKKGQVLPLDRKPSLKGLYSHLDQK